MPVDITIYLVLLLILAAVVQQDFIFALLYLFLGAYLIGSVWSRRSLAAVNFHRRMPTHAFFGDDIPVRLEVLNTGLLPVVWLRLQESVPVELSVQKNLRQVISLAPKGKTQFEYLLRCRKRGYYKIGPLYTASGDLLGLQREQIREGSSDSIIVYPRIVPLSVVKLPSSSPMGTLRHTQPIFEDPTRIASKRDYVAGDSLRRIDWKASAVTGRLQVKQYEPSIALETMLFLNLHTGDYDYRSYYDSTEMAIVVAASLCTWIAGKKQTVGLVTNGKDPLISEDGDQENIHKIATGLPPRKGQAHLIRILEVLARIEAGQTLSMLELVRRETIHLPWGTTLILVTGNMDNEMFDQLFQVRRAGMNIVIVLVGSIAHIPEIEQRAKNFSFPFFSIRSEKDLDVWRR